MAAGEDWTPHSIGSFSLGRWAGDALHLAGIVAMYPGSGRAIRGYSDIPTTSPPGFVRITSQSISARRESSPRPGRSSTSRASTSRTAPFAESIVHMLVLFKSLHYFPGYHRVRKATFPEDPPPATVVEIKELLPTAETRPEIQITASRELPRNLLTNPV